VEERREAGPSSSPSFLSLALASPSPGWTDDAADAVSDAPSPAGKLAQDAPCRRRLAVLVPALDPRVASRSRRQGKRHGPRPGNAGRQAARGRRACCAQPEEGQAAQHRRQVRLVPPPLPLDTLPSSRSTSCRCTKADRAPIQRPHHDQARGSAAPASDDIEPSRSSPSSPRCRPAYDPRCP